MPFYFTFPHPTNANAAIIKRKYRMPTPYASRHACSRADATLFSDVH